MKNKNIIEIVFIYQNAKLNNEDFALTPYFSLIYFKYPPYGKLRKISSYGIGFSWLYFSIGIAIAFNIPKEVHGGKQKIYRKVIFKSKNSNIIEISCDQNNIKTDDGKEHIFVESNINSCSKSNCSLSYLNIVNCLELCTFKYRKDRKSGYFKIK